ncbi:spermatogenesis-associated protein 22 [Aulostomus maculatus]
MRRLENQSARPTAGCLSVPLFNQKKRNRVPLTSAPSESEFFSHSEYLASPSSAAPHNSAGSYGCYQASAPLSGGDQSYQGNKRVVPQPTVPQEYGSHRPAPTMRSYATIPHPCKVGGASSEMGKPNSLLRQQHSSSVDNSSQGKYQASCSSESARIKQTSSTALSPMGQRSSYKPASLPYQQLRPPLPPVPPPSRPSACATHSQKTWAFTNSFGQQSSSSKEISSTNKHQSLRQTQDESTKPEIENTLRILTAVIGGMRHWSQFKDKVPYLFEIFATLDSAVTMGHQGAKNFLMRNGKEVVQCVFYETEQELPRLIRGQVHRCVGNYDRHRDTLRCVSVRPGQPSEQRNAQEAIKACDAEMRALVKLLREV